MCLNERGDNSALNSGSLKLEEKFAYLGSSVSSTERDMNARLAKAWKAIAVVILKSRRRSFLATVVLIQLYGCTTWTLTKRIVKKTAITKKEAAHEKTAAIQLPTAHLENYPI